MVDNNNSNENTSTTTSSSKNQSKSCVSFIDAENTTLKSKFTYISNEYVLVSKYCSNESSCIVCRKENNDFDLPCADSQITNDATDFNITCDEDVSSLQSIVLGNFYNGFGVNVNAEFIFEFNKVYSQVGFEALTDLSYRPNIQFDNNYLFGLILSTAIVPQPIINVNNYFGVSLSDKVTYNPYNPLNPFETGYGYNFYYTRFATNPYNELPSLNVIELPLSSVTCTFKTIDDRNLYTKNIDVGFGYQTSFDIKYADTRVEFVVNYGFGISSKGEEYQDIWLKTYNSFFGGYNTRLYAFTTRDRKSPYLNDFIGRFGYSMSNNHKRARYFDLSVDTCCKDKYKRELLQFDLANTEDYDVIYGFNNAWDSFGSTAMLTAQPRFSSKNAFGISAHVKDNSVYLTTSPSYMGFSSTSRGLRYSTNIDLIYGNYLPDQDSIIIELSQDNINTQVNYSMSFGISSISSLAISTEMKFPNVSSGFSTERFYITIEEKIVMNGRFGTDGSFTLSTTDTLFPYPMGYGYSFERFQFYEAPIYSQYGFYSEFVTLTIASNDVMLDEEGELLNENVFTNKNGDPYLNKPKEVSIEGYPFQHKIKGHCF